MSDSIGAKIELEGEAQFKQALSGINQNLKVLNSEMKIVTAQFGKSANSMNALTSKNTQLNKQIQAQKEKLAILKAQYDKQNSKLSELGKNLESVSKEFGENSKEAQKAKSEYEKQSKTVSNLAVDMNKTTASMVDMERQVSENVTAMGELERAEKEAEDAAEQLRQEQARLESAEEQAKKAAEQLRQEQERVAAQVSETSDKLGKSAEALSSVNRAAMIAGAALGALGLAATKVGMDFESQMSKVESISGASAQEMETLKDAAKKMGIETKFSATESGQALEYMAMAGWKTEQMVAGLPGIMYLAAASGEDLALTSDIVTDALTAFGLKASDSAHFADVLAQASSSSNTNVAMMGETFKYVAPVAGALGYRVEDVAVAIGLMANAGIKGESAGTALRGILTNLAKPTAMTVKYIEGLRISLTDTTGEMKPLSTLLGELRGKFANLTEAQKAEYAAGIAGKEAMSGLLALVSASDADFNNLTKAIENSNGTAKRMAETMNKNLKGQLTLLKSSAEGVGIAFYEKFEKQAAGAVEKLTAKVGAFGSALASGDLDGKLAEIAAGAAGAGTALIALNVALAVKDVMNFVTAAKAGTVALEAYTAATKAGAIAQGALNLVQAASPLGLIAIAAGAAATAFIAYKAITHEATGESELLKLELDNLTDSINNQKAAQEDAARAREENLAGVDAEIDKTQDYVNELKNITDANGRVKEGYEERAAYLAEQINSVIPDAVQGAQDEAGAYYNIKDSIEDVIFAKKKEMALEAGREEYEAALKGQVDANKNIADSLQAVTEAQKNYNDALRDRDSAKFGTREWDTANQKVTEAAQALDGAKSAYDNAKNSALDFQNTINAWDAVTAASGPKELETALQKLLGASDQIVRSTGDNQAAVEQAVASSIANYQMLVSSAAQSWDTMSDSDKANWAGMIEQARASMEEQITEFNKTGGEIPIQLTNGVIANADALPESVKTMLSEAAAACDENGQPWIDSGALKMFLMSSGILDGKGDVIQAANSVADEAKTAADTQAETTPETGDKAVSGVASGISENAWKPEQAMEGAVDQSVEAGDSAAKSGSSIGTTVISSAVSTLLGNSHLFTFATNSAVGQGVSSGEAQAADASAIGAAFIAQVVSGMVANVGAASTAAAGVSKTAVIAGIAATSGAPEIGRNLAAGFADGISQNTYMATAKARAMAEAAANAAKEALGIHSPSRVMRDQVGIMIAKGVAIGIESGIVFARRSAKKLGDAITKELTSLNDKLARMEEQERKEQAEKELKDYQKAVKDKYAELEKAEKKDKQKILDDIAKLQSDWNEKQVKAEKDAAKLALQERIKSLEDFKKEYDSAISEIEGKQKSMADKLAGYGELFEKIKPEIGPEYLKLGDLQDDIDQITAYGDALQKLKDRGISDSLMNEITSMSVEDALDYAAKLLGKSDEAYAEYMKKWDEKQRVADEIARNFYSSEFRNLQKEFVDKVPQELDGLKTEMQGIGKNSAIGLADGFWSKKPYIISTFKSVLESALAAAKASMEIHSPSRKWAEVGSFMAQGLGVGFTDQMRSVARQINSSIPVPTVETSGISRVGEGIVNGLASVVQGGSAQSGVPIILQVNLDGKQIARTTFDPLQAVAKQRGVAFG